MTVKSAKFDARKRERQTHGGKCLSGLNGASEFGIHFAGSDCGKGMRVYSRSYAKNYFLPHAVGGRDIRHGAYFVFAVGYYVTYSVRYGKLYIRIGFIV